MAVHHKGTDRRLFPSWAELLVHTADRLERENKQLDADYIRAGLKLPKPNYLALASHVKDALGPIWAPFLKEEFNHSLDVVNEESLALPKLIWQLGSRIIITTNYEKVLRWSCPNTGDCETWNIEHRAELAQFLSRQDTEKPTVWHLHGSIEDASRIILTQNGYDLLYSDDNVKSIYEAALHTFRSVLSTHTILFIGFSFNDEHLGMQIQGINRIFEGCAGPHYALVRECEKDRLKDLKLPVEPLTFSDFGQPLLDKIEDLKRYVVSGTSSTINILPAGQQPKHVREVGKKIALLTASPLDDEQHYTVLLKEIKKISCPIDHFSLSIDNLNNLQCYDYLLILTKVVKDKLLIEDDHLCSRKISFEELEQHIGNGPTAGIFIFVDQMPDSAVTAELFQPTLILADLDKKQLESTVFQLFRKNNLDYFDNSLIHNRSAFQLSPLTEKFKDDNNIHHNKTPLPDSIDPKTVRNFIGRTNDLEQICRKLMIQKEEGGVLTIKGSGGIGKTATVKKIAVALSERGYFEGGVNFVECEPITDCRQFQYKVATAFNLEQADDLKQYLRDHHDQKSRLIILDNFETLLYLDDHQAIKTVLGFICDYATIVITSRELLQIEGEVFYEMRPLTTDEALEIFRSNLDYREIKSDELTLLRQDIIENLLDNNPLAIKLITGNMPKGKSFAALKEELETDLFSKISDSELEVFDSSSDLNIAKKKSIYGSILYSYRHLLDNEQRAFELLSLFPDGIELEMFKKLTHGQHNISSADNQLQQTMITDHVIKALENKSMIENNNGQIKLQSIVGKFADGQLRCRDNLTRYYRNAFVYNHSLVKALNEIKENNERFALDVFNSQQGNFLKSITYCNKVDIDTSVLLNYLHNLSSLFSGICSLGGFIRELSARSNDFQGMDRKCVDVQLLHSRYFDGDFTNAYAELQQLVPLEALCTLDKTTTNERQLILNVINIYEMEGEALYAIKYLAKNMQTSKWYPSPFLLLGEFHRQLLESSTVKFCTLEVRANMGLLTLEEIDDYLAKLYDKDHLERMQVSYTRSKLTLLERQEIETLVIVNPYTRGLKGLMLAFVEPDATKAGELYQEAMVQLAHIKYFYVEAVYFFSKFLQIHNLSEFDSIYRQGLGLARKHHYRFLQYRFEQLLHTTDIAYDSRNYPLPDNEDFIEYIQFLIKNNQQRNSIK